MSGRRAETVAKDAAAGGIEVADLSKKFIDSSGRETRAIDHVSLSVPRGEFLVLLGPSGCGKTTLLRCLAGLETPDEGVIELSGRRVFDGAAHKSVPVASRRVGMVFQNYALWPHMSVEENIAYPLTNLPKQSRMSKQAIRDRVRDLLQLMNLDEHGQRKPGQLSGGQQQRVAVARAIAAGSDLVLFDEPLSNIDAKVRERLRAELRGMQQELGFTAVYVTHDQEEALELADRIAVLKEGRIAQLGTSEEIYNRPGNTYVADFVGTSNLTSAAATADPHIVDSPFGEIHIGEPFPAEAADRVRISSRASAWQLSPTPRTGVNVWEAELVSTLYLGWYSEYRVSLSGTTLRIWDEPRKLDPGAKVWIQVPPQECVVVHDA